MAKAKSKKKPLSIMKGVGITATALKLEVMELIETAMKKLENGLAYLEKELHDSRVNQQDVSVQGKKTISKNKSRKVVASKASKNKGKAAKKSSRGGK